MPKSIPISLDREKRLNKPTYIYAPIVEKCAAHNSSLTEVDLITFSQMSLVKLGSFTKIDRYLE